MPTIEISEEQARQLAAGSDILIAAPPTPLEWYAVQYSGYSVVKSRYVVRGRIEGEYLYAEEVVYLGGRTGGDEVAPKLTHGGSYDLNSYTITPLNWR